MKRKIGVQENVKLKQEKRKYLKLSKIQLWGNKM